MAEVQLRQLRVSAEMDASGYAAGARDLATASREAGAAAAGLGNTVAASDQKIGNSVSSLERLKRTYIDGYAASAKMESALAGISRGLERGAISAQEAALAADGVIRRLGIMGNSGQIAARGQIELAQAIDAANARLTQQITLSQRAETVASRAPVNDNLTGGRDDRFRRQNLGYQLFDIGQSASMGMPLAMIAAQQGPQIAQLYAAQGGLNAAMKDFGVILGGVARIAGPFIAMLAVLYGGYKILEANSVAAGLAVSDATRELAAQAAPIGSLQSQIADLAQVQTTYNSAIAQAAMLSTSSTDIIVANSKREYDAKKQLLELEMLAQEAKLKTMQADIAIAGQGMKERVASQVVTDPSRAVREGFSDPRINGGIPFVRLSDDISGLNKTMATLDADPATNKIAKMRAEMTLGELAVEKLREALKKDFQLGGDPQKPSQIGNPLGDSYWSQYSAAQLAKQKAQQNPLPSDATFSRQPTGARSDIAAQVQAQQALVQAQADEMEKLRLEASLIGANAELRARATAALQAEQELRQRGISILSAEGRQYIANAQAMAAERVELERRSQLGPSRDPAGGRSTIAEQITARQSLLQAQRDEIAVLGVETQMIGATTKERSVILAALQAEQTLRRQGISELSAEGQAYIENAKAIAASRVEIERRNQLALSRDPAGARADIAGQVQARQSLFETQNDELEKLRLEASLVGASAEQRARATAALQAEQELRQRGITLLSQEGQLYIANAQAMASARAEIERQNAAYSSLQTAGGSAIDSLTVGTGSLRDRLKAAADTMLQWIQQLTIANPLKNALFGSNLPTMGDLFSGRPAIPGATSTASMMVTAGTVMVNGGVMGGQFPAIPGLASSTTSTGTLSSVLGISNGVRPTLTPGGIVNSPVAANDVSSRAMMWRQGISQIESGSYAGNYNAIGPMTRTGDQAYGRYQVMGANIPSWSEKYYGQRLTPSQYLANPKAQDAVFDGEFGSYVSKYGEGPAATKWFTGSHIAAGRADVNGMTDTRYSSQFTSNMQKLSQTSAVASKDIGTLGDTSTKVGTQITDGLGKLATPAAVPQVPAVAPTAPAGGNIFSSLFGGFFKLLGFADGTDYAPGGMAWVGERGRELVNLPRGSQVTPNHKLPRDGGARSGGVMRHEYNITVAGNGDKELLARMQMVAETTVRAGIAEADAALPERLNDIRQNPYNRAA